MFWPGGDGLEPGFETYDEFTDIAEVRRLAP